LNDLWQIQIKNNSIKKEKQCKWKIIESKMNKPKPRHGHSMIMYNKKIFIYGGKGEEGIYDDLWMIDVGKDTDIVLEWKEIKFNGDIPSKRFGYNFGLYNKEYLFLQGGFNDNGLFFNDR
jgi:hypothetical protein